MATLLNASRSPRGEACSRHEPERHREANAMHIIRHPAASAGGVVGCQPQPRVPGDAQPNGAGLSIFSGFVKRFPSRARLCREHPDVSVRHEVLTPGLKQSGVVPRRVQLVALGAHNLGRARRAWGSS